jgi:hypothetical protein
MNTPRARNSVGQPRCGKPAQVQRGQKRGKSRREIYRDAWALAQGMPPFEARGPDMLEVTPNPTGRDRAAPERALVLLSGAHGGAVGFGSRLDSPRRRGGANLYARIACAQRSPRGGHDRIVAAVVDRRHRCVNGAPQRVRSLIQLHCPFRLSAQE